MKDYPLAFLRRRRDLPLRREAYLHVVLARQPSRLTEEVDVVVMNFGAVPCSGARHGGVGLEDELIGDEPPSAQCGLEALRQEEEEGGKNGKEGRACSAAPPLPLLPLLIGLRAAKPKGRPWDLLRPRPHAPTFTARGKLNRPPRSQRIRSRAEAW